MNRCYVDYKYEKVEGITRGYFNVKGEIKEDICYIDFKLRYYGTKQGILNVEIMNEEVTCTRQIKLCEQMGVYISLPWFGKGEYSVTFSEEIDIEEILVRNTKYDFGHLLEYATEETEKNRIKAFCDAHRMGLSITWFVTWLCNYKCPFCWELQDESQYRKSLMKTNQISPEMWATAFNKLTPREIYFTGGEPTLYKRLPEVFELLDSSIKLKMTSNFGPSFRLEEISPYIKANRFSVLGLSLHPSEVNINHFLTKMDEALAAGYNDNCDLGIEMVLYPNDLKYVSELLKYCEENRVKVILDDYHDSKEKYVMPEDLRVMVAEYKNRAKQINTLIKTEKYNYGSSMAMTDALWESKKEIVLYGAGNVGTQLVAESKGANIKCFTDVFKAGDIVCDKEVLAPEMATKIYPDATYIITVQKRELIAEAAIKLFELGIRKEQIKIYEAKSLKPKKEFIRGKQPIWCPAGMSSLHVDPNGDAYPCMVALDGKKIFGEGAMPHYQTLGSILNDDNILNKEPIPCWESFRCSACDYGILEDAMYEMKLYKEGIYLPVPQ